MPTIHARLCADPDAYPPADPETGWTIGGIYSILANPKYTGYQVFGRRPQRQARHAGQVVLVTMSPPIRRSWTATPGRRPSR